MPGIVGSTSYRGVELFLQLRCVSVSGRVCQELLAQLPIEVSNYSCICVVCVSRCACQELFCLLPREASNYSCICVVVCLWASVPGYVESLLVFPCVKDRIIANFQSCLSMLMLLFTKVIPMCEGQDYRKFAEFPLDACLSLGVCARNSWVCSL